MAELFALEIDTPYRRFFSGNAEAVTLTLIDGDIGVYAHHAPFTAPILPGVMRVKGEDGEWRAGFVSDGILEVRAHTTFITTDAANWPEEIDRQRVEAAKRKAEATLASPPSEFEERNARDALNRAEIRLKVADMSSSDSHTTEP
jgi:F-type H+-transporting ATPase subunit epsilon